MRDKNVSSEGGASFRFRKERLPPRMVYKGRAEITAYFVGALEVQRKKKRQKPLFFSYQLSVTALLESCALGVEDTSIRCEDI